MPQVRLLIIWPYKQLFFLTSLHVSSSRRNGITKVSPGHSRGSTTYTCSAQASRQSSVTSSNSCHQSLVLSQNFIGVAADLRPPCGRGSEAAAAALKS
eukprot:1194550-Prorocentrum_minimum.AAC.4